MILNLSDRLSRTTGKKVYGYLKSDVKAIVDQIVAELAENENIRELYDLWYEQRENVLRTYTDHFPERVPLEQNKEFKSIRNAVIQESLKINNLIRQAVEPEPQQDVMETELPPGEEPDPVPIEDSDRWSDHDHHRFIQKETGGEADAYETAIAGGTRGSGCHFCGLYCRESLPQGRRLAGCAKSHPLLPYGSGGRQFLCGIPAW